ncbi:MAG: helix-turn-helix domain-containing protein [Opitutaceae bacterium]|nr:helix-turn-helix domain-containing protein [Opitutaceae bacterium]
MPAGPASSSCHPHQSQSVSPPLELPAATRPFAPEVFSRDGLSFWFQQVGPNYFGTHRHPHLQMALGYGVRDGEFAWQEDGIGAVERSAGGDLVWLLPGNTPHSLRLRRTAFWTVFYLHPQWDIARDVTVRATLAPLGDYVRREGLIGDLGTALRRERTGEIGHTGHVLNLGALLGSCLLRAHGRETAKGNPLLALPDGMKEGVRAFVLQHLQKPLTLPMLARAAGMGADYFSRRLRFTTGLSAEQFVLQERLNHAQALLRTGEHTVEEVAELCGFQSHSTLTKRFTLRFGRPPRSYLPDDVRI